MSVLCGIHFSNPESHSKLSRQPWRNIIEALQVGQLMHMAATRYAKRRMTPFWAGHQTGESRDRSVTFPNSRQVALLLAWFPNLGKIKGHRAGLFWLCQLSLLVRVVAVSPARQGSLPAKEEQGRGFGVSSAQFDALEWKWEQSLRRKCEKLLAIIIFQTDIQSQWEFFICVLHRYYCITVLQRRGLEVYLYIL